jgi:hypothetical protein
MIIEEKSTPLDGKVVCGERFIPADGDSAFAVYERNGRVCGVTYEMGYYHPYLRCNPAYQLPPFARDKRAWSKLMWEFDDDRAMDVRLDEGDGEIMYRYQADDLPNNVEAAVEESLGFLLSDEFHGALVGFVRSKLEQ